MEEIIKYENKAITTRTPELIAAEINSIKNQTRRMMLYNAIEIGRRLVEAKEMLPHGEWGKWLREKVDYSQRTANNLMRLFEEYGSAQITLLDNNTNSQAFANLSYSQAVALLGVPEEEREAFIQEHDIENMSTRELQQAIKEREEAKKQKEEALKKLEEYKRMADEFKAEKEKLQNDINKMQKQIIEAQKSKNNEEVERLKESLLEKEKELKKSIERIEELEQELKDKPETISTAVVEKIPEEVERELHDLRKKVNSSKTEIKFNIHFDTLVKDFKSLLTSLAEIEEEDPEIAAKYKNAVHVLITKMIEKVS